MYFHSVVYALYASDVKSAQTDVRCFVSGYKVFGLRGEGRREGACME